MTRQTVSVILGSLCKKDTIEKEVDKQMADFQVKIEEIFKAKEKEVMTV